MGKRTSFAILNICLIIVQTSFVCSKSLKGSQPISDYIRNLNYDPNKVLYFQGDLVNPIPTNSSVEYGTFKVYEHKKVRLNNARVDVEVLASNVQKTFPGSLLLANSHILDNNPDVLPFQRAPLQYTFILPGMTTEGGQFTIIPSYKEYKLQRDSILKKWFKYFPTQEVTATSLNEHTLAYTMNQMAVELGTDFKLTDVAADIDFDSINKARKTVMIHKFKQIFYTVGIQSPNAPDDVFGADVTLDEVKGRVNDENPPVLVDTVSYGRVIYVKTETNSVSRAAKSFIQGKLRSFDVSNETDTEVQHRLKNLNFVVYVMGEDNKSTYKYPSVKSMREVYNIISHNITLTPESKLYPVSYSMEFLKDNSMAVINGMTEYNDVALKLFRRGGIHLDNFGTYTGSFYVAWDEVSYDENGAKQVARKGWSDNWNDKEEGFSYEIVLGGQSENIEISARANTGSSVDWWRTLIDFSGVELIPFRVFQLLGTQNYPYSWVWPPIHEDPSETKDNDQKSLASFLEKLDLKQKKKLLNNIIS